MTYRHQRTSHEITGNTYQYKDGICEADGEIGFTQNNQHQLEHKHGSSHAINSHVSLSQVLKIIAKLHKNLPQNNQRLPGPVGADINSATLSHFQDLDGLVENATRVACTVLYCH